MVYPTADEVKIIAAAEQLVEKTMARYDPSHDNFHVQRVRKTAMHLAKQVSKDDCSRKPDLLTVELAALLHDVLDKKYATSEQAADPYKFFLPFFEKWAAESGVNLVKDGRARDIAKIVTNVSWSTEKKLREARLITDWHRECVELHCVQDADRLDAIGAFGILRCAAYSAAVNRPLYAASDDPARPDTAIQHFYDKLFHIREQLKTAPGKVMAEKRHQLMLDFVTAIDEEYSMQL
ncbi:uncharacterized protein PHACADRAFT_171515 [Phanerochaete carnosa HHB-10118-sp]|uniref:HD domain-containing protein n=1 Tax=Phanerochaete carnosa (strain HHB-10118-sp) TaxID=650164 RepID=K5X5X3_PHACS|nr:uncharacterized protein PHACADRAFT_171515 [Phanerochaete carnosa HHB-10118-sp]EKM58252.1 hypothetical protein PHACADRAFT_171515 [Phanerochaete carnosa HHB-10118-sp]